MHFANGRRPPIAGFRQRLRPHRGAAHGTALVKRLPNGDLRLTPGREPADHPAQQPGSGSAWYQSPVARSFRRRKLDQFQAWWRAPSTPAERISSIVLGGWAGLWIGGLGRIALGQLPIPLGEVFWAAIAVAVLLAAAGAVFPKLVRCLCFPFAFFGAAGGGS